MLIDLQKVKINITTPSGESRSLLYIPNFKIQPLQKTLIKGPSGTGKSTFLHLIAGLMNPNEGHLNWDNHRVSLFSDSERSKIRRKKFAIIFQRLNLLEHLSLRENLLLAMPIGLAAVEKKQRLEQALESVSLIDRADDFVAVLSLGEQQRLAIARALAQNPEVILADEPTSSLDQKNADSCMRALLDASKNSSLIVVSHDERIQKSFSVVQSITDWGP